MGAFGSFIAGAGQAAGQYGREVRERRFVEAQQAKDAFARMIGQEAQNRIYDPATRGQLLDLQARMATLRAGQSPVPLVKEYHELVNLHPHSERILDMVQGKPGTINLAKPDEQPGTSPVQPGTPMLQSPGGSGGSSGGASGQASQPSEPPTPQLSDLIGMKPIMPPQPQPAAPPTQSPAPAAAQPSVSPIQGAHQIVLPLPAMRSPHEILDPYLAMTGGVMTPMIEQMAQSQFQNEAELHRAAQIQQLDTDRKLALLNAFRNSPEGQKMFEENPGLAGMMEASAYGLNVPPGMMSSMFTPVHMNGIRTEDFARQFPNEFAAAGIDPKTSPVLNVTFNKMTGKPMLIEGKGISLHFLNDAQGNVVGVNPYNPGAAPPTATGGVAPSQIAPHLMTTPTGEQEFVTARGAGTGQPIPGVVNPQFVPRTTSGSHTEIKDIDGQMVPVQVSTSSTSQRGTGRSFTGTTLGPGPSAPAAPVPSGPTTAPVPTPQAHRTSGPSPRVGESLGDSQSTFRMRAENTLGPVAQKVMIETQPVLDMMTRVKQALEPYKNSDVPASTLLPRIAYSLGFAGDTGALLSALELSRITQAAAVLKGSGSRARQILEKAMVHTPNAWVDSPKLMIDKLTNITANINAIQHAAQEFGKRYPGMDQSGHIQPVEPAVGTIEDGYRYKGGGADKAANWEKVNQ